MYPTQSPYRCVCLPLLLAGVLCCTPLPAHAEQAADPGAQIEKQFGVVGRNTAEGRALNDQLNSVVQRIVQAVNAGREGEGFQLCSALILGGKNDKQDRTVNAFALPDGRIYVTLGLMRLLQSSPGREAELAFVVGHEVTHVVEHHSERQMRGTLPAGLMALLAVALTQSKAVGDLSAMGQAAYASQFSRQDEYRADEGGLRAMSRAGYDPRAATTMLQRLREKEQNENRLLTGWFGSHPLTSSRISRATQVASQIETERKVASSVEH